MLKRLMLLVSVMVLVFSVTGAVFAADVDGDGVLDNGFVSRSQTAVPNALLPTGKILVDHGHGNGFDVSGYTDYLAASGWTVDVNNGAFTAALLAQYDIVVVPNIDTSLSVSEVSIVKNYVFNGGGLWLLGDYNKALNGTNELSASYGFKFNGGEVTDPTNNEGNDFWPTIYTLKNHPITNGIDAFGFYAGSSITVNAPAVTVATGDDDTTSVIGAFCPVLVAASNGSGRVVGYGDETPLHPSYYPSQLDAEEKLLLDNIVEWLLNVKPTTVDIFPGTGKYVSTSKFDFGFLIEGTVPISSIKVYYQGSDVTAAVKPYFIPGTLNNGGVTYRYPGLSGGALGTGSHVVAVEVTLSDGTVIADKVNWVVLGNTEP